MFEDAELLEWIMVSAILPFAGWVIWLQHRVSEIDQDLSEIKHILRLVLNNTGILRGAAERNALMKRDE